MRALPSIFSEPSTDGAGAASLRPRGLYSAVDALSGYLLCAMFVLSPWLFGTTEAWSVWLMNALGYGSGGLLLAKWFLRWRHGALALEKISLGTDSSLATGLWVIRGMALLTALALFYTLLAALNARATYLPHEQRFEYYNLYVPWLPFTYDSRLTWQAFWNYLGLACFFWALRDWLIHPAREEADERGSLLGLPARIQRFLWILSVNATLLALIGVFQRLSGTTKLLWFRSSYAEIPEAMFGPYAFRGNAAQYLNLCWPVVLGFWWALRQRAKRNKLDRAKVGGGAHVFLLLCAILVASAPMIATSQGGTLVMLLCLALVLLVFGANQRANWQSRCTLLLVTVSILGFGGALGWDQLGPNLRELFRTPYANPNEVVHNARRMALDYPAFGVGPGAFRTTYQLYREDTSQTWQAFLHDDWMEVRVTFGLVGSLILLSLLAFSLTRWFLPGGIHAPWELVAMLWVAVGGCLAHAKFSFPLQVYSILLTFLALLALLTCFSRPETPH